MRFITGILGVLSIMFIVLLVCAGLANGAESGLLVAPGESAAPQKPLSAIAVSQCGGALALFIQLDANHLLRADPRQSDMFTNVDGKMMQTTAAGMKWEAAYDLASSAVITTHVVVPCDSKEATT